jgi:hypothetical protein
MSTPAKRQDATSRTASRGALPSFLPARSSEGESGAAQESNLPSDGFRRLTGFEEPVAPVREAAWLAESRAGAVRGATLRATVERPAYAVTRVCSSMVPRVNEPSPELWTLSVV